MTVEEAYLRFIKKVNKDYTNDNISADRDRFVLLFNEIQNRYLEWILDKRNEDEIRYVQKMLMHDVPLTLDSTKNDSQCFTLPEDYFDFANLHVYAKKGTCKARLKTFEIKKGNSEELICEEGNEPSFEYRETFYNLGQDKVFVYNDGSFTMGTVQLTYYRYPKEIDISGYTRLDGNQSTDIAPEWDDKVVNRLISACAKYFNTTNENLNKVAFDREEIFSKI